MGSIAASGRDAVRTESGLTFATVGGLELKADIHRAPAPDAPVVLYAHGGGWAHGTRADGADARLRSLAGRGVSVVSVDYRLAPRTTYPQQVHDIKGAVRWLRAHGGALDLPTERLGVWGASAGAYLASLVALSAGDPELEGEVGGNLEQSSAVQAAVHWFGQADLARSASRSDIEMRVLPFRFEADLLGLPPGSALGSRGPVLSLLNRASASAPPFLIAHGDSDRIVPSSEGFALHDAIARAGGSSRLEILGGAGHEDEAFDRPDSLAMTAAWLRAVLCG
jgi:acetyl esterase/lipase